MKSWKRQIAKAWTVLVSFSVGSTIFTSIYIQAPMLLQPILIISHPFWVNYHRSQVETPRVGRLFSHPSSRSPSSCHPSPISLREPAPSPSPTSNTVPKPTFPQANAVARHSPIHRIIEGGLPSLSPVISIRRQPYCNNCACPPLPRPADKRYAHEGIGTDLSDSLCDFAHFSTSWPWFGHRSSFPYTLATFYF